MVQIIQQDLESNDSFNYNISIPKDWSGGNDKEVTVIVNDVCLVIPKSVANEPRDLLLLRLLETMLAGNLIGADDIRKATDRILYSE
jgi:hypothetical protein